MATAVTVARRAGAGAWATMIALAVAACAPPAGVTSDRSAPGSAAAADGPEVTHVHALDVDEAAGIARIATHYGIYGAELTADGSAQVARIGDWQGDAMGMARVGDRILFSGHPAAGDPGPANLGVVLFADDGQTSVIALDGEVDFHAMAAHGERVAGWDSATGAVFVSDDRGETWSGGAIAPIRSLAWAPGGERLLGTTADGLVASTDGGETFERVATAPLLVLLAANDADATVPLVAGIDTAGVLHVSDDGIEWVALDEAPILPEALAVSASGRIALANTTLALVSDTDGRTWQSLFRY
jgi:hypothetical protein